MRVDFPGSLKQRGGALAGVRNKQIGGKANIGKVGGVETTGARLRRGAAATIFIEGGKT